MKTLEFDLSLYDESEAFAFACLNLNKTGIPYTVVNSGITAIITITDGY